MNCKGSSVSLYIVVIGVGTLHSEIKRSRNLSKKYLEPAARITRCALTYHSNLRYPINRRTRSQGDIGE
jgi:hypothetical protein